MKEIANYIVEIYKNLLQIIKNLFEILNCINKKYQSFAKKGWKKYILQFFPSNIYIFILFLVMVNCYIPQIRNNTTEIYTSRLVDKVYGEIYKKPVEQKIDTRNVKRIEKFGIHFATYNRINTAVYQLDIYDNDNIIYTKKIKSSSLLDNSYEYFDVNKKINKNHKYKYVVTPLNAAEENAITITKGKNKELAYSIINKSQFYDFVIIVSFIYLLIFFVINFIINNNIIKDEKSFMYVMLIYLLSFLFIFPPMEAPDEPYHFYRSYKFSQYDFTKSPYNNMIEKKINIPGNYNCLGYSRAFVYESAVYPNDILACYKNAANVKLNFAVGTRANRLITLIPSALGIKLGDIFTNSPLFIFYCGRLFNFVFSFFVLLYALKIIPKHKQIFLLVVFIPMFVQQSVSFSYDAILNSLCVLIVAYLIKFFNQTEEITTKELIIYSLCSLVILDIKLPYILIPLLILFVGKDKLGKDQKKKIMRIALFLGVILLSYFVANYIASLDLPKRIGEVSAVKRNTISELIKSPTKIFRIMKATARGHASEYYRNMIACFGWLRYSFDDRLIMFCYLMFGVAILADDTKLRLKKRIINIGLIGLLFGGIFLSMYLSWTPYNSLMIEGVQGRYLLPLLLPLFIFIMPNKKLIKLKNETVYSFINMLLLASIITLLVSFY